MELLNPSWLWLIPAAIGVLIYAYARKGSAQEAFASSTMFLRHLSSATKKRRLPVFPLRLLFDLILSTLLISALVGLIFKTDKARVAVIIDNSLSMSANNALDDAKDLAVKTLKT